MTENSANDVVGTQIPPTSTWVRVLRSYGPTSNNLTMFDEYVDGLLRRAKVEPIRLSTPMLGSILRHIKSGDPGSLLIAGTAGDGKTYHCRTLWAALGGDPKTWSAKGNIKELQLNDGRLAVFVKDLSEFNGEESDSPLERLEQSVLGGDDAEVVVLAANHGQLLDRLRDLGERQGRIHPLRKPLQECFLQAGPAPARLAVFDLSTVTTRQTLDEITQAVAGHIEWNNCQSCHLLAEGKVCPIDENRRRLLGEKDDRQISRRLGDLIEIARLDGQHLPVRDLLALCSNLILGHSDAKLAKENLMTCGDVAKIQESGVDKASIYTNAFGANLPRRRAADRPIFNAMSSFGVGDETTNTVDGLLVYGKDDSRLSEDFNRLIESDSVYGMTPKFRAAQNAYLEGSEDARLEGDPLEFLQMLEVQRRRLYFILTSDDAGYPRWSMTVFRYAGEYLELVDALKTKSPVSDQARTRITKGLNRVMTGLLVENADRIFIASSGGFTQSRVSVLCDDEVPARRQAGKGMAIRLEDINGLPRLELSLAPGAGNTVSYDLTPTRFEFLARVAEGALPASFSNECLEDLLAFKAKLLRKAELVRRTAHCEDDDEFGAAAVLTLNVIDIEPGGRAFVRPVTIRASA